MPRKSNTRAAAEAGSIRQRPDRTWEARYITGHDPGTGKPIRKSVYAQTQREVRRRLAQAIAAIDSNDYFEPSKMPLAQWLDIWAEEYMGDKRYSTKKTYKANIETHIKPALGAVRLSQLMPHTIQKFYNELLASGQKVLRRNKAGKIIKKNGETIYDTAPMSPKTVRNIHGTLTKAFSTAVSIGYLRTNPADRVTLPRIEKKELVPLTDAQVKDFLQVSTGDGLEIIMKVIQFTGMRESEALGLTWDCVDFKAGTVKVCKQLQKRKLEDSADRMEAYIKSL
nr:site-specific integrase [uncultured Oscillibacter sp.]